MQPDAIVIYLRLLLLLGQDLLYPLDLAVIPTSRDGLVRPRANPNISLSRSVPVHTSQINIEWISGFQNVVRDMSIRTDGYSGCTHFVYCGMTVSDCLSPS